MKYDKRLKQMMEELLLKDKYLKTINFQTLARITRYVGLYSMFLWIQWWKKSGFNRTELHTATVSSHTQTETRKQHRFIAEITHVQ